MLTIRQFRKSYQGVPALHVEALSLPPGIHWLRGANGSGKTTFFRSVAGMLPCEGEIWLDDRWEIHRDPVEYRLRVNYAEAEPAYPDFLTARDLIRFVGKTKQSPSGQGDELAERFGLTQFWQTPFGTYSSGMRKKTSLVLALLGRPRLVMLDEPLNALDIAATQVLYQCIRALHTQGVGFLLSSHQDFRFDELPIGQHFVVENQTLRPA
ncbi:MAG: ABC transporter ATP-binding protein [Cytophagaceae bacterium]|nr:ABC transporter ATP-binding protein [Cytophagaceae bacterium]